MIWSQQSSKKLTSNVMLHATTGTCYNGECEGLHLPVEEIVEQATWPKSSHPKVIVTAGMFVKSSSKKRKTFFLSQVHRQPQPGLQPRTWHLKRLLGHQR